MTGGYAHGTMSGYNGYHGKNGCRCCACTRAKTLYTLALKKEKKGVRALDRHEETCGECAQGSPCLEAQHIMWRIVSALDDPARHQSARGFHVLICVGEKEQTT